MKCPNCSKEIRGLTGLQELKKFQKHLQTCRKNPKRQTLVDEDGNTSVFVQPTTLLEALDIRANSGQ